MICIGCLDSEKEETIAAYRDKHDIEHMVIISADECSLSASDADMVRYSDVIMYVTFYRLLREITPKTLIVLNECLRTQNRYDLSYNCIRNFLNLTSHQLVFSCLPLIDSSDDFMILFDFDTRSRWKRRPFDAKLIAGESEVRVVRPLAVHFERIDVPTSGKTRERYDCDRERLFREIGGTRDPHIIPRNLCLVGGPDKLAYIDANSLPLFGEVGFYVARNKRLSRKCVVSYTDTRRQDVQYTVVEFPHRRIDFCDFVRRTGQVESPVLVADLKVDHWYYSQYTDWSKRLSECYASLSA